MVAFAFDPVYHSLVVFLSAMIPGVALGWPFLKKSELSVLEKLIFCFFIGMVVAPSLLIVENIIGLKFSLTLVLVNLFLLTATGLVYGSREQAFQIVMPAPSFDRVFSTEFFKKHAATALLLVTILLSFWIRIQSYGPIYSELDPYFYIYGSGEIIRFGEAPIIDDTAWWPEGKTSSHRAFPPLKMYTEAQWYTLYTNGGEYNNYLLFVTSSWFPPISAALLAAGAYFLFASMYGKRYGIFAAFLAVFLPVTIFKMSAGVNEAAPFGMASIFLVLGIYSLALRKNDWKIGALAGLALFAAVAATNFEAVIAIPLAGYILLQSLDYFARGARSSQNFLWNSTCLVAGVALGSVLEGIYLSGPAGIFRLVEGEILGPIVALILAYLLSNSEKVINIEVKKRLPALAAAAILCMLIVAIPNPIGTRAKIYVKNYIGAADFNAPLQRTIAEQNVAGATFEGEAGFLAFVPENHFKTPAKEITDIGWNALNSAFQAIAFIFSFFGKWLLDLTDSFFNVLLGTNISGVKKADSLLFFFAEISILGMGCGHFARKGEERDAPNPAILVLLVMLPILYIGLNKIKFTIFVGLALLFASVAAIAEMEKLFRWIAQRAKASKAEANVRSVFLIVIVVVAFAQIAIPSSYSLMILKKSFEPRYQDAPEKMMPKLASICEGLRPLGYYDAEICAAGYDENFANSINSQFDSKICLVSQLSMKELVPGTSTEEQQASAEAKAGASFRCNRLADYWIDSMEWINKNLQPEDRVTSWWDYGHWINYFGDRKTVLRNEHASSGMIGRVAHDYIDGTSQQLIDSMNYFDSRYVLFDVELTGASSFGGKYGALNYLACAHDNGTSVAQPPGTSDCEYEHSPERVLIPNVQTAGNACTISESQQRAGVYAYRVAKNSVDLNRPAYCVGDVTLANEQKLSGTYYLDRKDANGDLIISKGFLRQVDQNDQARSYEVVYNDLPVWPDGKGGGFVGGMGDAKTKFYTSNLYLGFYLEKLPGFDLVYKSKNGEVKIYRMKNFIGNKEGIVDPLSIARGY